MRKDRLRVRGPERRPHTVATISRTPLRVPTHPFYRTPNGHNRHSEAHTKGEKRNPSHSACGKNYGHKQNMACMKQENKSIHLSFFLQHSGRLSHLPIHSLSPSLTRYLFFSLSISLSLSLSLSLCVCVSSSLTLLLLFLPSFFPFLSFAYPFSGHPFDL